MCICVPFVLICFFHRNCWIVLRGYDSIREWVFHKSRGSYIWLAWCVPCKHLHPQFIASKWTLVFWLINSKLRINNYVYTIYSEKTTLHILVSQCHNINLNIIIRNKQCSLTLKSKRIAQNMQDLESALKESRARWKIVVGHHAIRSIGHHGDTQELIDQLLPILRVKKKINQFHIPLQLIN